jgi:aminopeptidase YwaD
MPSWLKPLLLLILPVSAGFAQSQQAVAWSVKPEWVRAHEEFLASDAMQGRRSATHDEEIAATYVASEFMGYGLKTAPAMPGYIQTAEVIAPELDGHATLTVGGTMFHEGRDFDLLISPGKSTAGKLVKIAAAELKSTDLDAGAAVIVTGVSDPDAASRAYGDLRRKGAGIVLLVETPGTARLPSTIGGRTRTPARLAEEKESRGGATLVLLRTAAAEQLASADGKNVTVAVKEIPVIKPRETYNAIGYLQGTDPKAGTILLTAHLDHLGVGQPVNGDAIYNGANDDAAGTTAVLELAHALAAGPRFKRSVLFVCYGSEEIGELGSTYFGEHPTVPLKDLVANLEFEMIGNQDPKMPRGVLLLTGWDRSNLGPTLKAHGALLGPDPYPEQHFFEHSDNYALALDGVVAHTSAGWGTPPTYHQPNDDLAHLDVPFMTAAIQSLVAPIEWLANSEFKPDWNPGGKPQR